MLAIGGPGYEWLKSSLAPRTASLKVIKATGSGHFIPEEKPQETVAWIKDFLK